MLLHCGVAGSTLVWIRLVVNQAIVWSKWPVCAVAVLLVPSILAALRPLVSAAVAEPVRAGVFAAGGVGYAFLWQLFFRRRIWGSSWSTFEHELTHALFAWATLHRVRSFRITHRRGGHVQITGPQHGPFGPGNWLIDVSPYFFTTLSGGVILVMWWGGFTGPAWQLGLGATLGYHATSTAIETHREQDDLKKVGWLFALLFLPAANLLAFGAVTAFALGGARTFQSFLKAALLGG